MAAIKQSLGWVCLAVNTAASAAPRRSQDACSDPVASNYNSLSPTTAAAQFNNSGCLYSCGSLCSYFSVDCARTLCLIDLGADSNWTDTNSTLYVSLGTSLIVQGRVDSGVSPAGRTQLIRRIESTSTGGGTVILRHIAMVGLHATSDSLGNFRDGGALRVLRSNLTIEHCVFAHNKADGGGAVKASGTIRIINTLFENNTALDSGGAVYATGLLDAQLTGGSIGSSLVVTGCAFLNNTAANYGGGVYIKNDQLLERFNGWVVSGCRGVGNYGTQLASALVWQGAQFVAVQDDALLIGVDDLWAYVSMRPDGPYNGRGCVLSNLPPQANLGHCSAALNDTVLPDGFRCSLGCNTQRFGASNTDQWSTTRPGQCYEGVYVWSGACAEHRCVTLNPNSSGDLHLAQQGFGNVCAHNGSCWVFPPPLSTRSEFIGPVQADGVTTSSKLSALPFRANMRRPGDPKEKGNQSDDDEDEDEERELHVDREFAYEAEDTIATSRAAEVKVCNCPLGWWGARCHHLDLCAMEDANTRLTTSKPRCMHGGNCTRLFNGAEDYLCTCRVGYGGRVCEIAPWETGAIVATATGLCFCLPVLWAVISRRRQSLGRQSQGQEGRELASSLLS